MNMSGKVINNKPKSNLICHKGFVLFAFLMTGFFLFSCTYAVDEDVTPLVEAGPSFSLPVDAKENGQQKPWWEVLNDPIQITYHIMVIIGGVVILGFSAGFSIRKPKGF